MTSHPFQEIISSLDKSNGANYSQIGVWENIADGVSCPPAVFIVVSLPFQGRQLLCNTTDVERVAVSS